MTTVLRGRYGGLCANHRIELADQVRAESKIKRDMKVATGTADFTRKATPTARKDVETAAKKLARAGRKLEQAVARRRAATDEAKKALEEFNDSLNDVKELAQELLSA
jgi:hypothetical protein